jgi:hypothetical protein
VLLCCCPCIQGCIVYRLLHLLLLSAPSAISHVTSTRAVLA